MKLSILHPSRSRPEQASKTLGHWLDNIEYPQEWEYILSVDSSDPYLEWYYPFNGAQNMRRIVNDNHNVVQAANQAAKLASGDILILISDDFECPKGWNKIIINALKGKSGVLKTFDGVQRWIVTLSIMTMHYYREQGHIYDPDVFHLFADTIQTHKADLEKKLIIRNDIVFKHNHYSVGGQPKDVVNIKADSTWAQGEKVYIQRLKEWKAKGYNIFDLSPEATKAGHIAWMKKKGIR